MICFMDLRFCTCFYLFSECDDAVDIAISESSQGGASSGDGA